MGVSHSIGPKEREWYRRCRRSWDFGSPNRRDLERRDVPVLVDTRRAVRAAMAVWYFPGMWEWPRQIVLPRALQAFDEAAARRPEPADGTVARARRMLERYFAWAPTVDA